MNSFGLPKVTTYAEMPECKPPKDSEAHIFDALKENNELKERVAKLEEDLEEMYNKLVKLYWAVDALSNLDWCP